MSYDAVVAEAVAQAEAEVRSLHQLRIERMHQEEPSQWASEADLEAQLQDQLRNARVTAARRIGEERDQLPVAIERTRAALHAAVKHHDAEGEAMYARELAQLEARAVELGPCQPVPVPVPVPARPTPKR
jgi:hypothetical protein